MAGSGVAIRLHEFRERQDSKDTDGAPKFTPKVSRLGRDTCGLYPGELGRVHTISSKDCGCNYHSGKSQSLHASLQSQNYQQSFDICTMRALILHQEAGVREQRLPQTAYQEHFGLQSHPSLL